MTGGTEFAARAMIGTSLAHFLRMIPTDFRFHERLRVRWSEIDSQKIVFNGHYLMYFDTAVAGYWRALALPYAATMEALSGDLYVRKATVDYHASARYDDLLDVGMRCARIGNSSIVFTGMAFRQAQRLVGCELVYVFADPATQTSRPVPATLRAALDAFEAGQAMTETQLGSWADLGPAAREVRTEVFVDEQRIPATLEADDADDAAVHALVRNRFGRAVATGRLVEEAGGVARIGRMAVTQTLRGSGHGRTVLEALIAAAVARGNAEVVVHAQSGVEGFYRRAGFAARGAAFVEAGIEHIAMVRRVDDGFRLASSPTER